jgi:hypothetical protein
MRMQRGVLTAVSLMVALCAVIATPAKAQTWVAVPGTLSHISVGDSTTIWGVNSADKVYEYNNDGGWTNVPGSLTQVAVGTDGTVWGINSSGQTYQYQSSTNNWTNVPGTLTSISVGGKDLVWGLNSSGYIYRYDPATKVWDQVVGTLSQISVASDGTIVGLNAGELYFFEPILQQFIGIPGVIGAPPLSQVVAGFGAAVFAVDTSGNAYQFDVLNQQLKTIRGTLTEIAVGSTYSVYGVNSAQVAYEFSTTTGLWTELPGAALTQIAVSPDGTVWGLSSAGLIYNLQP